MKKRKQIIMFYLIIASSAMGLFSFWNNLVEMGFNGEEIKNRDVTDDLNIPETIKTSLTEEWNITWDYNGRNDEGYGVGVDSEGYIYVSGQKESSSMVKNFTLRKYNQSHQLEWSVEWGGSNHDYGAALAIDSNDNIYVVGTTESYKTGSYRNLAIIKWNKTGDLQWSKVWNLGDSQGLGIAIDKDSNEIYVSGYRDTGDRQIALIKYAPNGSLLWDELWGSSSEEDQGYDVALDSIGDIYVCGRKDYTGGNMGDGIIVKFSSSGIFQWAESWDYGYSEYAYGIDLDDEDNIYVTGAVRLGGPGGANNMYLLKFDKYRNLEWNYQYTYGDHNNGENGRAVNIDSNNDIYVVGYSLDSSADPYALIMKFDCFGNNLWKRRWRPSSQIAMAQYCAFNSETNSTNLYITGYKTTSFVRDIFLVNFNIYKPIYKNEWNITQDYDSNNDIGYGISTDIQGNILVGGNYLNSGSISNFTLRMSSPDDGSEIWTRNWGGADNDNGRGIAIDSEGNIYQTGYTKSYDLYGDDDATLVKYDKDGNFQWNVFWGGSSYDRAESLFVDQYDNIYIAGYTGSLGGIDPDYFVVKYNKNGDYLWNASWGGSSNDYAYDVAVDSNQNVYICGWAKSDGDSLYGDAVTVKFNRTGDFEWKQNYNNGNSDIARGIAVDSEDYIYVTGKSTISSQGHLFLLKYNTSGNLEWDYTYSTQEHTLGENGRNIEIDFQDDIYIVGDSVGEWSNERILVMKFNNAGIPYWNKTWAPSAYDQQAMGYDLALDCKSNPKYLYITGTTLDTNDLLLVKFLLTPGEFQLESNSTSPDNDGIIRLNWSASDSADTYSVYTYNKSITEINSSLTVIEEKILGQELIISELLNGPHYFVVVAHNDLASIISNCVYVEVKLIPKFFELSVNKSNPIVNGQFRLEWNEALYADNYSIFQHESYINEISNNGTLLKDGIEILNYNITGYTSGNYYFMVYAYNEYGNISSNCIHLQVAIPPKTFFIGSNVTNFDDDGSFLINWTESAGADNYTIYRHNSFIHEIENNGTLIDEGIEELNYTLNDYGVGHYYFIVYAFNETGATKSNCLYIHVADPPSSFTLESNVTNFDQDGTFLINWTTSLGADNYTIYRHYNFIYEIDLNGTEIAEGIEELNYTLNDYGVGHYYFIVYAFNETGATKSNCVYIHVADPPKSFAIGSNVTDPDTDGNFLINWTESLGAVNYSIYSYSAFIYEIDNNGTLIAEGIENLNYTISGLISGKYYFIVYAFNSTGQVHSNCIQVNVSIPPKPFMMGTNSTSFVEGISFWINWSLAIGADNYSIYWDIDVDVDDTSNLYADGLTNSSIMIKNFASGTYYFRILACNETGSVWSNIFSITIAAEESTGDTSDDTPDQPEDISIIIIIIIISIGAIAGLSAYKINNTQKTKKKEAIRSKIKAKKLSDVQEPPNRESLKELKTKKVKKKKPVAVTKPMGLSEAEKAELAETESEIDVQKNAIKCVVHRGNIVGEVYICPNCQAFYCQRCAKVLKSKEENCWSCGAPISVSLTEAEKETLLGKSASEIIQELMEDDQVYSQAMKSEKHISEIPGIDTKDFTILDPQNLDKIDALNLSVQEKTEFIRELLGLSKDKQEKLINEMLESKNGAI